MLNNKNFAIIICNYFAAQISRFSQYTILIWVILEGSKSAFSVAFVGVCAFLPYILFGTMGGLLADKFKRKHVLIVTQLVLFCTSSMLFFLFHTKGNISVVIAYLVIFINGLVYVIEKPSKSLAVRELINAKFLTRALALIGFTIQASRMIGPLLGGFLISLIGLKYSYGPILFIHIFTVFSLFLVDFPNSFNTLSSSDNKTLIYEIKSSIDYFFSERILLAVMLITITIHLFASSYFQMISVVATKNFEVGAGLTGLLMSCEGMGSMLGFFNIMIMGQIKALGRLFYFGALVMCIGIFFFSLSSSFLVAAFLIIITGFGFSSFAIMFENIILRIVPVNMQGRILGIGNFVIGFQIIGALIIGALSEYLGVNNALRLTSIIGVLLICFIVIRINEINKKNI